MYEAFAKLVNGSIAAGFLVLAVLALRLALRKAPGWTRCLLWALVAVQLLCPVRIESDFSAYNLAPASLTQSGAVEYVRYNGKSEKPSLVWQTPQRAEAAAQAETAAAAQPSVRTKTHTEYLPPLMRIWAAGVSAMLLYALISWLRLRRMTAASLRLQENVFLCDELPSPFILGVLRPKIFLPSELNDTQRAAVLAHERAHLARRDQAWKPLGFVLLSVHWFNPLLWLAYILLCRDIELACDEKVVKALANDEKQAYSRALLQCSLPRHMIAACPLAFGEVGVKTRIKAILNYKKPAFWAVFAAVLVILLAAVCFLTQPKRAEAAPVAGAYRMGENRYMNLLSSAFSPSGDDGKTYLIETFADTWGEQLRLSIVDDDIGLEGSYETRAPWRELDTDGAPTWASFFPDGFYPIFAPSIDGYSLRQVRVLNEKFVLFRMDAELWLGRLWGVSDGVLMWCVQLNKTSDEASLYALTSAVRERQRDALAQLQTVLTALTQDGASAAFRYYEEGTLRGSRPGSPDAALAARLTGADWSVIAQEDALSTVWELAVLCGDGSTLRFWKRSDDVLLQTADGGGFWFRCAREDGEAPLGDAVFAWYNEK